MAAVACPIDVATCNWQGRDGATIAARIVAFLADIGLPVAMSQIDPRTFLPGMTIIDGTIHVDPEVLIWPGDLLHEAGHVAVTSPERRRTLGDVGTDGGDEMAAIAWSYAAACASHVAPEVLFHLGGYKGGASALIENFAAGRYIGVPLLVYYGMTAAPSRVTASDASAYPTMKRWLR